MLPDKLPPTDRDEHKPACSLHPDRPAVTRDGAWLMCERCSLHDLPFAVERFRQAVTTYYQHTTKDVICVRSDL
jgi:hypothetical protein